MERISQYPYHLARLVAARLKLQRGHTPSESVLTRLLETLYFASLKTDEGRQIICTVNFVDRNMPDAWPATRPPASRWVHVPFDRPLPLDVRNLTKLARAADPGVSSLTVYADRKGQLFIWGLVDQEPRHTDRITLDSDTEPARPGLFHVTINGIGNVSVYHHYSLVGSLSQNTLVEAYHDVLWSGPIHETLCRFLRSHLDEQPEMFFAQFEQADRERALRELLLRWLNSLCRILVNIQHYHHGGGLLITPCESFEGLNIKYRLRYDRLVSALVGMIRAHSRCSVSRAVPESPGGVESTLRVVTPPAAGLLHELEERKNEVLGVNRFIASLSCVDGVVLLDRSMAVYGFGVELRTDNRLSEVSIAGDTPASPSRLRVVELTQFGTRHRAMMRYCDQHPGTVGFVVSQDGDIQAMTRVGEHLILWENIDVQLAFKGEAWISGEEQAPTHLQRLNARLND